MGGGWAASFSSQSPRGWLGLGEDPGWGCQKVALWVSPSSCGQVIPAPEPERRYPPRARPGPAQDAFPGLGLRGARAEARAGPA